jgi:hypothetical protein
MRLFVDTFAQDGQGERLADGLWLRTGAGLPGPRELDEIEWIIEPGLPSFVLYQQWMTRSIRLLVASVGSSFDAVIEALRTPGNDITPSRVYRHLTILGALIHAGQTSNLTGCALMRMTDPHRSGVKNWLVAIEVGEDLQTTVVRVVTMAMVLVDQSLRMPVPADLAELIAAPSDLQELGTRLGRFPAGLSSSRLSAMVEAAGARWQTGADR